MSEQPRPEASLASLRAYTPARIALARTGFSLTTHDALELTLAHAQARDAVHAALSLPTLLAELHARHLPTLTVRSAAPDRPTYIRRPDLGRTLSATSRAQLAAHPPAPTSAPTAPRLTLILADGLSALATDRHALPLLDALLPLLRWENSPVNAVDNRARTVDKQGDILSPPKRSAVSPSEAQTSAESPAHASAKTRAQTSPSRLISPSAAASTEPAAAPPTAPPAWQLTPIILAEQARVALGDEIGLALGSSLTLMLLGERPGLSAADSLGAYLTWAPAPGRTDAQRNCISNIRTGGLDPTAAARRIAFYLQEARRLRLTGTALKDPDPRALELLPTNEILPTGEPSPANEKA
jgi:ethanolamine ammonia-lyase small subunit